MFLRKKIFMISSAGGHLTQLLRLAEGLQDYDKILITESTPVTRTAKTHAFDRVFYLIHGGRESKLIYPFKFFLNFIYSLLLFFWHRPKVVISTGAHTSVPMCFIAKVFGSRIIFIETFAKVSTPTLTGRMIYRIADRFYIQWPQLQKFYPKAIYKGRLY